MRLVLGADDAPYSGRPSRPQAPLEQDWSKPHGELVSAKPEAAHTATLLAFRQRRAPGTQSGVGGGNGVGGNGVGGGGVGGGGAGGA